MAVELFFIRHGETDYNRQYRYCGISDVSLNEQGVRQISDLASKLPFFSPDIIFGSISKRVQQTARILFSNREVVFTPSLLELNFGLWEGLTHHQISSKYNEQYSAWLKDPFTNQPPSGESLESFKTRVIGFLKRIVNDHSGKTIVCITHAGPIKMIVNYLLGKQFTDFWNIRVDNASVSWFKIDNDLVTGYSLNKT